MATPNSRRPDFEQFLRVLRRNKRPDHLPFYEHIASPGFIARRTGTDFDRWDTRHPEFWKTYVNFWIGMGFDCVPMEIPPKLPLGGGQKNTLHIEGSESMVVITNREDFEEYPWPEEASYIEFEHFDTVSKLLPDGAKIVGGVSAGPYEWVSWMLGTIGVSYLLADDPELVRMVFDKIGRLHVSALRQIADADSVGALRQGDDLGFKTATFLKPDDLRKYVRSVINACAPRGRFAVGSGNSIPSYIPLENYLTMLDEALASHSAGSRSCVAREQVKRVVVQKVRLDLPGSAGGRSAGSSASSRSGPHR